MGKVKIETVKLSDIHEYDGNPRQISKQDFEVLKKSLKEFPEMLAVREIVVDEDGAILGGNQRYKALLANGVDEVVVKRVIDWTEEQKREFVIKDNIANGEWDMDTLANEWDDLPLNDWGLDVDWQEEEQEVIEDEVPEVPEEPKAKLGDIYQLGEHRLMCGDSTKTDDVEKLMDGAKADMVFTDPPYGVDIQGKYTGKIANDNLKGEELESFFKDINKMLKKSCKGNIYLCYEVLNSVENFNAFGKPDEVICFNKDSASFYSKNKYNRKFELIMFFENGRELRCDNETNVWDAPKSSSYNNRDENGLAFDQSGSYCTVHPTTKPLNIPSRAIKNSSQEGNSVLDLFGGSGSTLIACEQLNRKCYMMELDPHYVDVIIERWENFTGEKAVKL